MFINFFSIEGSGQHLEESAFCGLPMEIQHITRPLLQAATFVFFLFPLIIILILYIKISCKLRTTKFARMTYTSSSRCSSVVSTYGPEMRKTVIRRSVNKMLSKFLVKYLRYLPMYLLILNKIELLCIVSTCKVASIGIQNGNNVLK